MKNEQFCDKDCMYHKDFFPSSQRGLAFGIHPHETCGIGHRQIPKTEAASINVLRNNGVLCARNPHKTAAHEAVRLP